ncbi:MAG: M23 family metallopeptidase [Prevotellaceae bacterium]|jgi:hypothetical protein|nr:M23 family metallopeptidase [Prevotellaceae bacterium]
MKKMRQILLLILGCGSFLPLQALDTAYYRSPLDGQMPLSLAGNFGEPRTNHFHSGIDFRVGGQPGAKLHAVAGGYVARIAVSPGGYGNAIYINHPNGTTSVYAHLHAFAPDIEAYITRIQYAKKRFAVDENIPPTAFPVQKGQVIGTAGNSGNSFGAHLHFEIRETATAKTLNTVASGIFRMADDVAPQIHRIVFYEYRQADGVPAIAPCADVRSFAAGGAQVVTVPDTFFVAIDADDRQGGQSGILGLHRLTVALDNDVVFAYRMDGFLFKDTRYINSLYAYDLWTAQSRPMIKTYVEPGNNMLYLYDKAADEGLMTLPDRDVHTLCITAFDDAGNTSHVVLRVARAAADSGGVQPSVAAADSLPPVKPVKMYHHSDNYYECGGMRIDVPAGSLYRPVWFSADTLPRTDGAAAAVWRIHHNTTPLHLAARLHLPADVPARWRAKALMASYNSKGNVVSAGGAWDGDGVTAKIASFGNYFVTIDTLPPAVKPLFADSADLRKHERLSVKIIDDLSGVDSYSAAIDGEWALMEYDAKENVLHYLFNKARIKRNAAHTLTVTVSDRQRNSTTLKTRFVW